MLLETILWYVSITVTSLGFPCLISNRLKEIRANTELIGLEHVRNNVRDSIDRTIGQIIAATCQSILTVWSLYNLILLYEGVSPNTAGLDHLAIGFYIYDIMDIHTKPYGKTQHIFILHHLVAIFLIYLNTLNSNRALVANMTYLLMESSSATVNITSLISNERPTYKSFVKKINISVYGLTRVVLFPGIIVIYFVDSLSTDKPMLRSLELVIATLFYVMFVYWHRAMIKKYLV